MQIVVDANESRCGLAELLAASWPAVAIRYLPVGDVAIGKRMLVERKTAEDCIASLEDGRRFRQAVQLHAACEKPLLIHEGGKDPLGQLVQSGPTRGALLALMIGFRIPILPTHDLRETATVIRHIAA